METKSLNLADSFYAEVSKLKDEKSLKEVLGKVELMKWTAEKALEKATAYRVIKVKNMELDADGNINITPSYKRADDHEVDWVQTKNSSEYDWESTASGVLQSKEKIMLFNYRLARKILSTVIGRVNRMKISYEVNESDEAGYVGVVDNLFDDYRKSGKNVKVYEKDTYGVYDSSDKYSEYRHFTHSFKASVCYNYGHSQIFIEELEKELDKYDFSRWIDFEIDWDGDTWSSIKVSFNGITNDVKPITIRENK